MESKKISGKSIEMLISKTLSWGVWMSFWISVVGVVLHFINTVQSDSLKSMQYSEPSGFDMIRWVQGLINLNASDVAMLGVLLMLSTPLLRVVLLHFAYQKQKNKLYQIITIAVLCIILVSVLIGAKG